MVDNLSALCQYVLLFGLTVLVMRTARVSTATVIGDSLSWAVVAPGLLLACLLLAFTYGENALEAWLIARVSPAFAWHYWGFRAIRYVLAVSPLGYLLLWLVECGAAPFAEEFFFRGVLERALRVRFGASGGRRRCTRPPSWSMNTSASARPMQSRISATRSRICSVSPMLRANRMKAQGHSLR